MNKQPVKMIPGDELHLTLLMTPRGLNFVTGQDREHLLAYGRAVFEAGQASKCLHQITEPAARFCPECGHVGDVGAGHRDCCPDGSSAFTVPAKWANELRAGFKAQLAAAPQAVQAAVPDAWAAVHCGGKRTGKIYNTCDTEKECNDYIELVHQQSDSITLTAKPIFLGGAPAHPAEGVPTQAAPEMNEDGYLPCPFCGSHQVSLSTGQTGDGTPWHYVECESCAGTAEPEKWNDRPLAATQPAAQGMDAVRALFALHAKELENNAYAYFELAHTRQTGWCAWITDHPRSMPPVPVINPDRKVIASGQGSTPDAACAAALAAQAKHGGAA